MKCHLSQCRVNTWYKYYETFKTQCLWLRVVRVGDMYTGHPHNIGLSTSTTVKLKTLQTNTCNNKNIFRTFSHIQHFFLNQTCSNNFISHFELKNYLNLPVVGFLIDYEPILPSYPPFKWMSLHNITTSTTLSTTQAFQHELMNWI